MNSKAPIIAAWISIIVIIISASAYIVRMDARLDFLDERVDKIIELCCPTNDTHFSLNQTVDADKWDRVAPEKPE